MEERGWDEAWEKSGQEFGMFVRLSALWLHTARRPAAWTPCVLTTYPSCPAPAQRNVSVPAFSEQLKASFMLHWSFTIIPRRSIPFTLHVWLAQPSLRKKLFLQCCFCRLEWGRFDCSSASPSCPESCRMIISGSWGMVRHIWSP